MRKLDDAEERVSKFYNTVGWEVLSELTEDARRFEDLREVAAGYVKRCRLRVLRHIPQQGANILDMASGPIQYTEYLEYSKHFEKRYCVDLSVNALEMARQKIGDHGVFLHGSFFDIPMEENFFDCAISLHTIYHMNKEKQEAAVRKLLMVTKPGKPVIIVYSNPETLISKLMRQQMVKKIKKLLLNKKHKSDEEVESELYFYVHPISWWNRFSDISRVEFFPWRSFNSNAQKTLTPNNKLGSAVFRILFFLEERYPTFFVRNFQYPMIVLTKR